MCNTKWQMQTPFYDGVFCKPDVISLGTGSNLTGFNVHDTIGVQGQVFTIVNSDDAEYQKINLFDGAWQESVLNSTLLPHGRVWVRNPNQPSPP